MVKEASAICDNFSTSLCFWSCSGVMLVLVASGSAVDPLSTLPRLLCYNFHVCCWQCLECCSGCSQSAIGIPQRFGFWEQLGDLIFPKDSLKGRGNSVTSAALLKITSLWVISAPLGRLIINRIHMLPVTWVIESMSRSPGATDAFGSIGC